MNRTRISEVLKSDAIGSAFTVMGWVRTRRDSKAGFSFIELNDGSSIRGLQIIAEGSLPNYDEEVKKLQTGCSIKVRGMLSASPGKGQSVELRAEEIEVFGWADPARYPLQKKGIRSNSSVPSPICVPARIPSALSRESETR